MQANRNVNTLSYCESDSCPSADNLSLGNLSQRFGQLLLDADDKDTPRKRKRSVTARSHSSNESQKKKYVSTSRFNKTIPKQGQNQGEELNVVKEVTAEYHIDTTLKRPKKRSSISLLDERDDEDVESF